MVEKLFKDPSLKNQNSAYLWINCLKFYTVVFIVCQIEGYQKILKQRCRTLIFTSNETFLKNRKRSGTSLPSSFSAWSLEKVFILLYSVNWPNFFVLLKLTLCFWSRRFSYMTKKSGQRFNSRTKIAFKMKYKSFFIFFKEISRYNFFVHTIPHISVSLSLYWKQEIFLRLCILYLRPTIFKNLNNPSLTFTWIKLLLLDQGTFKQKLKRLYGIQ